MAPTDVSNCVLSIVASFTSGLDVFRRLKKRKSRTNARKHARGAVNASRDDEEVILARSLRQGPEDIGREYARSIGMVGEERFGRGDAIAQTSLAEILLRLNSGLVVIISTFLEGNRRNDAGGRVDYRELTRLSESSRVDTCRTLRALMRRILGREVPRGPDPREEVPREQAVIKYKSSNVGQRNEKTAKHTKVRGPMLARVVIADSARPSQVALVRPGEKKKKSKSSTSSNISKAKSTSNLAGPTRPSQVPSGYLGVPAASPISMQRRNQSALDVSRAQRLQPRRKLSATEMYGASPPPTSQPPLATQSTTRLGGNINERQPLQSVPDLAPIPAFEPRRRKQTPTYYSVETTGTRLGEIPLHKWAEPYDFDAMSRLNQEAMQNGWPLSDMDQSQVKRKRGLGLFRMFRKKAVDV